MRHLLPQVTQTLVPHVAASNEIDALVRALQSIDTTEV